MTNLQRTLRWLGANQEMTHIVAGDRAPGFYLKALDGKEYSLQTLVERGPVVAAFFKVECPVCQFTFPFLERIYKAYGDRNLAIVGVSQNRKKDTAAFIKEY